MLMRLVNCLLTSTKLFNILSYFVRRLSDQIWYFYIATDVRTACRFSVPVIFHCVSLAVGLLSFIAKKFDLKSFDISAKLSVFCAFTLNVEICFQCFDSVGRSSGSTWPIVSMYECISAIDYVCLVVIHDVQ